MPVRSLVSRLWGSALVAVLGAASPALANDIFHLASMPVANPENCQPEQTPYTPAPQELLQPPATTAPLFTPGQAGLEATNSFAAAGHTGGYIDMAMPVTMFRMQFDSFYGMTEPDRAEFFYPKCGCFARIPNHPAFDPNAPGPPEVETGIDYQEFRSHLEFAFSDRFSVFGELPVRFINPDVNDNTAGMSDLNFGFKYALHASLFEYFTFQFRVYAPTGDADRGLGTDHWALEPGFLYYRQLGDRLFLQAELRDIIPVDGTEDFAGNVLRYGVGFGYRAVERCEYAVTPTLELVGWTVLDGLVTDVSRANLVREADGDTIVNIKPGVRFEFGGNRYRSPGLTRYPSSLYAGYAQALTGDTWYENGFRLEYRLIY